ncbi:unnamed protein product [Hymenolepis diminuta]|uniref:RWD domain-containing protein n=1 Tax=Hymenolepis diminuta TaxID=6216 RepID=A0A564Y4T1_HYMDI|nr:unnamed protein product [Hymenolepis diminuta]
MLRQELVQILGALNDPSNKLLDCKHCSTKCLLLGVKVDPDFRTLILIPDAYPQTLPKQIFFYNLNPGNQIDHVISLTDVVLLTMINVAKHFQQPISRLAVSLNSELYGLICDRFRMILDVI